MAYAAILDCVLLNWYCIKLAPVYLKAFHVCSKHLINLQADLPIVGIKINYVIVVD